MHRALVALLPLLLLVPSAGAHTLGGSFSAGSPAFVNFLLDGFTTPDLAPGEGGTIRFTLNNTYPWRMEAVVLQLEIYRYLEIDVDLAVDASWPHARPQFRDPGTGAEIGRLYERTFASLDARASEIVSVGVVTDGDMPHGTLTKQGSYFVRTRMEFDLTDGVARNRSYLWSKGWYTDAQFDAARQPCGAPCPSWVYYEGLLNLTYLGSVLGANHSDGLLPDTGFSVKERMPLWPFVAVGGVMVASFVFAVLFYAEENPGKYPRLARWWLGVKGTWRRARPPKGK